MIAIFEKATGRIVNLAIGYTPEETADLGIAEVGDACDPSLFYVVGGAVTARPACTVTFDKANVTPDGSDGVTVAGLPIGATIYFDGQRLTGTGTSFKAVPGHAGPHVLHVDPWPMAEAVWPFFAY
ncbi:MAG: hypothetical protein JWO51_138 [Rhodospirillales bacterium]|nr:hypothetical protein [Rhodospirillales bacterium]